MPETSRSQQNQQDDYHYIQCMEYPVATNYTCLLYCVYTLYIDDVVQREIAIRCKDFCRTFAQTAWRGYLSSLWRMHFHLASWSDTGTLLHQLYVKHSSTIIIRAHPVCVKG